MKQRLNVILKFRRFPYNFWGEAEKDSVITPDR
jgi:hypothetical protein